MLTCAVARRATSFHTTFVPPTLASTAGHTTVRKARALRHFRHAQRTPPHPGRCVQVGDLHVALRQGREQLSRRWFGQGASLPATFSAHLTPRRRSCRCRSCGRRRRGSRRSRPTAQSARARRLGNVLPSPRKPREPATREHNTVDRLEWRRCRPP